MDSQKIVAEQTYHVPASKVWQALTDPEEMKKWYFDVTNFLPQPGNEFHFKAGSDEKKFLHLCKVTEVLPFKKIAYSWRYDGRDGNSLVTFEIDTEDDKTHLKLTHEGVDTFPDEKDFKRENFVEG